jgi:hypothetical protein
MTMTILPDFPAQTDTNRRASAQVLYRYLEVVRPKLAVCYDGDRVVSLGPIEVRYLTCAVEISFPDDLADDDRRVAVYVPGKLTLVPVVTVVQGLLSGWQVTP